MFKGARPPHPGGNKPFRLINGQPVEFEPVSRTTIWGILPGSYDADFLEPAPELTLEERQSFGQSWSAYMATERRLYEQRLWSMGLM